MRWDIFCRVIDNYGDIGVCWRLATQLAARGHAVRLFSDDPAALAWMAPRGCRGVQVIATLALEAGYATPDVLVEAFGVHLPDTIVAAVARANRSGPGRVAWINLEYLSAEDYVARSHGLASPVHGGAAAGVRKWFFFPGFTPETGGLLREPELAARQAAFDPARWLARWRLPLQGERRISLFCYEPPVLARWLQHLAAGAHGWCGSDADALAPVRLLVTHGRASAAVHQAIAALPAGWNAAGRLRLSFLPALEQGDFDHLLWAADVNFVRGEDSLVRALWAGRALVWQAYPQQDGAHHAKLDAFLAAIAAPAGLRRYHEWWNGLGADGPPMADFAAWTGAVRSARAGLLAQEDLLTRLLRFVAENR